MVNQMTMFKNIALVSHIQLKTTAQACGMHNRDIAGRTETRQCLYFRVIDYIHSKINHKINMRTVLNLILVHSLVQSEIKDV